eukprot:COSAG05_NODE_701_length_7861_cov_46.560423_3_plen_104_part_00
MCSTDLGCKEAFPLSVQQLTPLFFSPASTCFDPAVACVWSTLRCVAVWLPLQFMQAVTGRWPQVVIQFEDFETSKAGAHACIIMRVKRETTGCLGNNQPPSAA